MYALNLFLTTIEYSWISNKYFWPIIPWYRNFVVNLSFWCRPKISSQGNQVTKILWFVDVPMDVIYNVNVCQKWPDILLTNGQGTNDLFRLLNQAKWLKCLSQRPLPLTDPIDSLWFLEPNKCWPWSVLGLRYNYSHSRRFLLIGLQISKCSFERKHFQRYVNWIWGSQWKIFN